MKKEKIIQLLRRVKRPIGSKEIVDCLEISTAERPQVRRMLKKMMYSGEIVRHRNGHYNLSSQQKLLTGVISFNRMGYAFVSSGEGQKDIYISAKETHGSMSGDTVECVLVGKRKDASPEGRVIRVIERGHSTVTGTYEPSKKFGFVIPEDQGIVYDIFIPPGKSLGAKRGQLVVAEILTYPTPGNSPEGNVVEVLGFPDTPGVDVEIILRKHGIPSSFSSQVDQETRAVPQKISEKDITGRLDLRGKTIFTIDGEHARDFDDAISVELLPGDIIRLGVHIADVSHYVRPMSNIDKEAYKRGTSVYFPDRVVPMLPFKLSSGLCSLKRGADRLTLSVFTDIGKDGAVLKTEFFKSVINSCERMTYLNVHEIIEKRAPRLREKYSHLLQDLLLMQRLATLLRRVRGAAGSIDFDLPEPELVLDALGNPENVLRVYRNSAHMIVEEFMLLANKTVAKALAGKGMPAVFRVHEAPDPDKIGDFFDFVHNFGYSVRAKEIKSVVFKELLDKIEGKPEERVISKVMLKHMERAYYNEENLGHFGLAFETYTHFTSPIRRYPDLLVHRFFKKFLIKGDEGLKIRKDTLHDMLKCCSERERRAEVAERELVGLKKAQVMEKKIGEEFTGIISGVTSFGIFIELDDIFVEGLVHVSSLHDDFYVYDEKNHSLTGERLKIRYQLGRRVLIRVSNVSTERREIDFKLIKRI